MTQSNGRELVADEERRVRAACRRGRSLKSSTPCRNRFMRAMADVVRFFSWPKSLPHSSLDAAAGAL